MKYDITFHPSWWYENAGIKFTKEFFDDPEYRMEMDLIMRRTLYERFGEYGIGEKDPKVRPLLGTDLLAAGYLYSEIMGCEIKYKEDDSPQVQCLNIGEDNISDIKLPNLDESDVWKKTQKQIDYLMKKFGRVEPYINLMGIQNIALDVVGQEMMLAYYSSPEEIDACLEKITKLSIDIGKRLKALSSDMSGGVTAIIRQTCPEVYLTSNCSVEMISNDIYEEFLLKHDQILANEFKDFGVHHCGKTMEHVIGGYKKIKGLKFAEVGAFSDMEKVRKELPGVFLNARYSPVRLMDASESDIMEEVEGLVSKGHENGKLISVSCVGIDKHVTDEQIIFFLRACKEAGLKLANYKS